MQSARRGLWKWYGYTGRWRISHKGRLDYCSGADIGTHFLGGAMVVSSSSNVPQAFGYVLADRKDYQIVDNWNVFGMQGTGSRRVVIEDLFIPSHRMMELFEMGPTGMRLLRNQPGRRLHTNPMYHGQILPFLMFEVISVVLGAARGALDVYDQILKDKKTKMPPFGPLFEMPDAQRRFGEAQGLIDTAEAALLMLARFRIVPVFFKEHLKVIPGFRSRYPMKLHLNHFLSDFTAVRKVLPSSVGRSQ